jgi:hypothetical protein
MAIAGPQRWLSSMSNEIKKDFPLTVEGWDTWSSNLAQHGDTPWTWMGHCHGWAPASLLEEKPKHSVLARRNGKEILFTEGDIRGLLTKAWSGGKTEGAKFASSRCETNDIPTDENGRVLDGLVCNESQNFDSCQDKKKIYVLGYDLRAYGYGKGHIRYTESKISNDVKIALTESKGQDKYLLDFVEPDGNGGVKRTGKTASMHFTKGCRDTNPMTFHLATIQLIAPGKPGYILDKTRTSEVWNQPAFKYETRTVPVGLKNGSISKEDELIPVDSIDDKFEEFRAEGTKYLIQVETTLTYGVENGPFTHYKKDDEHFETDTYNYTLEFDENKKIIGGEWGHIPAGDEYKDQLISAESPDFIWQYSNSTTPMPYDETDIEYKFVSQLHKCSLNSSNLKSGNFDGIGEVKYQECALD